MMQIRHQSLLGTYRKSTILHRLTQVSAVYRL